MSVAEFSHLVLFAGVCIFIVAGVTADIVEWFRNR